MWDLLTTSIAPSYKVYLRAKVDLEERVILEEEKCASRQSRRQRCTGRWGPTTKFLNTTDSMTPDSAITYNNNPISKSAALQKPELNAKWRST